MSDAEKPTPDSPRSGDSDAKPITSANVISIEQARAELLRRPRKGATPPRGMDGAPRSRGREVPMPVTMPPGEHSAVIVSDTPAARAHIDKKTVHPGEAPGQTHEKKVRVKTHLDPRRAKTQLTDRRSGPPDPPPGAVQSFPGDPPTSPDDEGGSLWNRPSQAPDAAAASQGQRPSLVRPRPIARDSRPPTSLFVVGIMIAAAVGAIVVFMLGRQKEEPASGRPASTDTAAIAPPPTGPASAPPGNTAAAKAMSSNVPVATATVSAEPVATTAPAPSTGSGPIVKSAGTAPATKPSAAPATSASATTKPTATSILPFGKEEP